MAAGKASVSLLEQLHNLIAEDMLSKLEAGNCEAKDWAVIVKFLKDNGIDSLIAADEGAASAFSKLVEAANKSIANQHPN